MEGVNVTYGFYFSPDSLQTQLAAPKVGVRHMSKNTPELYGFKTRFWPRLGNWSSGKNAKAEISGLCGRLH
jgi:hypothetical protein